jgi:hypothetical protein
MTRFDNSTPLRYIFPTPRRRSATCCLATASKSTVGDRAVHAIAIRVVDPHKRASDDLDPDPEVVKNLSTSNATFDTLRL